MRDLHYIELDGEPIAEPDLQAWARWYEAADRTVALDRVGGAEVSTVFLGLDHGPLADGPPILYETMIFGGPYDQDQWRYPTRQDAVAGHQAAVARLRAEEPSGPVMTWAQLIGILNAVTAARAEAQGPHPRERRDRLMRVLLEAGLTELEARWLWEWAEGGVVGRLAGSPDPAPAGHTDAPG